MRGGPPHATPPPPVRCRAERTATKPLPPGESRRPTALVVENHGTSRQTARTVASGRRERQPLMSSSTEPELRPEASAPPTSSTASESLAVHWRGSGYPVVFLHGQPGGAEI